MYTYEDKVAAEKSIEFWKTAIKGHEDNKAKWEKLLSVVDAAISKGDETYVGPVSGKVITITPEIKANYKKEVGAAIDDIVKQIEKANSFLRYNYTIIAEYENNVKTKEEIKTASPEVTPVVNVNVAPVIPPISSPCAVSGKLADALEKAGKIVGVVNSAKMIADLAKKDPLAAAAAAAGLLGSDVFKKSADFLKQTEDKINAIKGASIPLGPVSEIAAAIAKANAAIQSATDCLNTAISSTVGTINAGSASVTNKVTESVSALDSSLDSISAIGGRGTSRSYKAMRTQIKNPVTELPKDIQAIASKMNGIASIAQMSAGLANGILNDVTSLTSAVTNITSGNATAVLAGVGTLNNAKTIVDSISGKVSNIGSLSKTIK